MQFLQNSVIILQLFCNYSVTICHYSDSSGSLWGFKRDEITNNVTNDDNASLFKHKASLIANNIADGTKKGIKIAVSLKYLRNFWRY